MITNLPRNCVVFLLLCELTRSAIYGSKKSDSHKRPTLLVDEVKEHRAISRHICVDHCICYFYNIFLPICILLQTLSKDQLDRSKATCSFKSQTTEIAWYTYTGSSNPISGGTIIPGKYFQNSGEFFANLLRFARTQFPLAPDTHTCQTLFRKTPAAQQTFIAVWPS